MKVTDIEPVSELKKKTAELIRRVRESRSPMVITQHGRAAVVIQDAETYEKQQKAFATLVLLTQRTEQARAGKTIPHAKVKERFERKIRQRRRG